MAICQSSMSEIIVGRLYCTAYPLDFTITRNPLTLIDRNFTVFYTDGRVLFKFKSPTLVPYCNCILLDGAGNPIVSLKQKIMSPHRRWEAYRGESSRDADLLFSVKFVSMIQFQPKLGVFLASNTREEVCDFVIRGSWCQKSYTVYRGETSSIIAQMHKKPSVQSMVLGKEQFVLTVYPRIDYAFVVALMAILNEIN